MTHFINTSYHGYRLISVDNDVTQFERRQFGQNFYLRRSFAGDITEVVTRVVTNRRSIHGNHVTPVVTS